MVLKRIVLLEVENITETATEEGRPLLTFHGKYIFENLSSALINDIEFLLMSVMCDMFHVVSLYRNKVGHRKYFQSSK